MATVRIEVVELQLIKARVLHFPRSTGNPEQEFEYFATGALVVDGQKIKAVGPEEVLSRQFPEAQVIDKRHCLLVPGLIDSHNHFPQTEIIASFGEQLLQWLENFTFPTEQKFASYEYARKIADIYLQQLFQHGTTTALAYCTVHPQSADALFDAASEHNMQIVAGKVCMDRNCPDYLKDDAKSAYQDSRDLIEKWHKQGRNLYAITPRFAPTSTEEQMTLLGQLAAEFPDTFIQSHVSENTDEIAWIKSLYPKDKDYLGVYERFGLVRERAVYGHGIHLKKREWKTLAKSGSVIAFCPSSNLFLGSGLYDMSAAISYRVSTALASDIGGGTSISMLTTQADGYKVCALNHYSLQAMRGLYLMTQGPASSYRLEHQIGNLNPDTYADFVCFDLDSNELLRTRLQNGKGHAADIWFALTFLAGEGCVDSTWVAGAPVFEK
ncbi:guanine deaminase [Gynuella sp.]|uniref:guanine deaminase n=1 Tax=Gynuella sp. TaxID=2969146 RepID=UPI003D0B4535